MPCLPLLTAVLDEPESQPYVAWSANGSALIIKDLDGFVTRVLPKWYSTSSRARLRPEQILRILPLYS